MIRHSNARQGTRLYTLPDQTCPNSGRQPHKLPAQHIIGETLDWTIPEADIETVRQMWVDGKPGLEICEVTGLHWLVLSVLLYEEIEEGTIKEREGGLLGCE